MRSLGVIFLADVVGYSKMMAQDEPGTLEKLREFAKNVIRPTLEKHQGTMIKSSGSGVVTMAEKDLYYTGGTIIMDHGHGISTIYSHLENILVSVGDQINQGDIIGTVGSTGRSTGPHLDFRVNWFQTRLDPMSVIN